MDQPTDGVSAAETTAEEHGTAETDAPSGRRKRTLRWASIGIVVVLVAAGTLYWTVLRDDRPRVQGGATIRADIHEVEGSTAAAYVPWGRLDLTIGKPREELPEDYRDDNRAPDNGRFVGLALIAGFEPDSILPMPFSEGGRYREPHVTLVADDERYEVPELTRGIITPDGDRLDGIKKDLFVAIDNDPDELSLEISYDGEKQTVSSSGQVKPGRFAPLADVANDTDPISCGKPHTPAGYTFEDDENTCTLDFVQRVPYLAGEGWADPGTEWLAVVATMDSQKVQSPRMERPNYPRKEYTTMDYGIGDQEPTSQVKANDVGASVKFVDPDDPDQVVFAVPDDAPNLQLDIDATFYVNEEGPTVPVSWQVDLP